MEARVISVEELAKAHRLVNFAPVFKVDATTVVKTGDCVRIAEAAAMKLARDNTTIPIPQVYNAYRDEESGHVRIVMEFVEGDSLHDVRDGFSNDQKSEVIEQLRDFLAQLRTLKGTFIGSVDGSACEDQLFTDDIGAYGPYANESLFNEGIVKALKRCQEGAWVDTVADMVLHSLKQHEVVFTHGDFCPRNIIVRGTKVVAVLDWELSGYYPDYWEYIKALYRPDWETRWVKERVVDKILKPCFCELAVILHTRQIVW